MKFRILHYPVLDSSNNLAKEFAARGAGEGTVVFSDYQTKGRGQFKRKWVSPRAKDLLFSLITRPAHLKAGEASLVTQLAAMSVRDVLMSVFKIEAKIKKPNDLLVNGKKICGILVESSTSGKTVEYMVIGIGLNVNSKQRELVRGATSIFEVVGIKADRRELLEHILRDLDKRIGES